MATLIYVKNFFAGITFCLHLFLCNNQEMSAPDQDKHEEEQDILAELEKLEQSGVRSENDMLVSGWDDDTADDLIEVEPNLQSPEELFLWAASEDKLDIVKQMLETNPEFVLAKDVDEYTALHK